MTRRLPSLFATLITAMVLIAGSGQLVGCGQKGPLYLPEEGPEEPGTDTAEPVAPEPVVSEPSAPDSSPEPAAPVEND